MSQVLAGIMHFCMYIKQFISIFVTKLNDINNDDTKLYGLHDRTVTVLLARAHSLHLCALAQLYVHISVLGRQILLKFETKGVLPLESFHNNNR